MQAGVEGEWVGIKKDFKDEELRRKHALEKDNKKKEKHRRFGMRKGHDEDRQEEEVVSDDGVEGECEMCERCGIICQG